MLDPTRPFWPSAFVDLPTGSGRPGEVLGGGGGRMFGSALSCVGDLTSRGEGLSVFQGALGERIAGLKRGCRAVVCFVSGQSVEIDQREELVSDYFRGYVEAGSKRWWYAGAHPVLSVRALNHFLRLPKLVAELSSSAGGQAIWEGLGRDRPAIATPVHRAASVLVLPERPGEYAQGRRRQTLRRKCREAERRGVRWAVVTNATERKRLVSLADRRDRSHPRDEYRVLEGSRRGLLVHPLMLAGYAEDDRPILVSITPTDGKWAVLQYFRTLEDTPEASAARYLLTNALAEQLVIRGVKYLADNSSPMGINSGLRHFQRMLGFRIFRVDRLRSSQQPAEVRPVHTDEDERTRGVASRSRGSASTSGRRAPQGTRVAESA